MALITNPMRRMTSSIANMMSPETFDVERILVHQQLVRWARDVARA